MSVNCGAHINPDDLKGVERLDAHPKLKPQVEQPFLLGAPKKKGLAPWQLSLPPGTPTEYPPYPGATVKWAPKTRAVVDRIKDKAPGIVTATYAAHGRTGEPWGIDIMVSPFNRFANPSQAKLGASLTEWFVDHWNEFDINYIIWWNFMTDGAGWFDYEPLRLDWVRQSGSSPNKVTSRHQDHVHVQIMNPRLGPLQ